MEEDILKEELVAFLELGEKYEVERLKELAEEKMLQLLDKGNMVKFLIAGEMFRSGQVLQDREPAGGAGGRPALGRLHPRLGGISIYTGPRT